MARINDTIFGDRALFPYQAETPISETIEFYTDVTQHHDGSEQRIKLRQLPRRYFEYTTPLTINKKSDGFNTLSGAVRKDWLLPIWTEGQYIGAISSGASSIICDTTICNFEDDGFVMLFSSYKDYELLQIDSFTDTSIVFTSNVFSDYTAAYLIPVEKAFIVGSPYFYTKGYDAYAKITFQLEKSVDISGDDPEQYNDYGVYTEECLVESGDTAERTIYQEQTITDFDIGPVTPTTNWEFSQLNTPYYRLFEGLEEVQAFKEWFYRAAGKHGSFYIPTFENNLRVLADGSTITGTLTVYNDSYDDYANDRIHLAIKDTSGNWYFREITGYTYTTTFVFLSLDSDLDLIDTDIAMVCYLNLSRFDSDSLELEWVGNSAVETSIQIRELTRE